MRGGGAHRHCLIRMIFSTTIISAGLRMTLFLTGHVWHLVGLWEGQVCLIRENAFN